LVIKKFAKKYIGEDVRKRREREGGGEEEC
jgi:hypothetical protein